MNRLVYQQIHTSELIRYNIYAPRLKQELDNMDEQISGLVIGLLMGTADAIPGVSGGTVLLLFGQYDRTIQTAYSHLSETLMSTAKSFLAGKRQIKSTVSRTDTLFLLLLIVGVLIGLSLMISVLDHLITNYQRPLYGAFTGLIIGSAIVMTVRDINASLLTGALMLLGAGVSLLIQYFSLSIGHSLPIVFISGVAATASMVLPGLSGALVLLVLGQYQFIISTLHTGAAQLPSPSTHTIVSLLTFGIGGLLGVVVSIKLIRTVLKRNQTVLRSFLVGLVYGSVTAPINSAPEIAFTDTLVVVVSTACMLVVIGFFLLNRTRLFSLKI